MKKLASCLVALAASALVGTAWAGQDKPEPQVRLELDLVDGSHIIGTPSIEAVPVQTSYAKMDVPLKQILTLKIGDDHETAAVDLRNGDKLKGVINLEPIKLETVFGKVAVGIEHISDIHVVLSAGVLPVSLSRGLVLYYSFDGDEDGKVTDRSGMGHHGIPANVVPTNDSMGHARSAYYFNGVNAKIDCGNIMTAMSQYTVSAWLRIDSYTHRYYMGPWGQQTFASQPTPSIDEYTMLTSPENSFGGNFGTDTRVHHPLPLSEWHLITQTYDGASFRQYDNGNLVSTFPAPGKVLGNACSFLIGSVAAYPGHYLCRTWFHGCIDEVRVYNRALSVQEISLLHANAAPAPVPPAGSSGAASGTLADPYPTK